MTKRRPSLTKITPTQLSRLKPHLDRLVELTETPDYIPDDPVLYIHAFDNKDDKLIAGFLAALMAWGRRDVVIAKVEDLLRRMDYHPHEFVINYRPEDFNIFEGFKHRTFKPVDMHWLFLILKRIYKKHGGFESFWKYCHKQANFDPEKLMASFHNNFFALAPESESRTRKHIATPAKNSACKRLWLFLRWTIRKGSCVDQPLMSFIEPGDLMIPLDVHVGRQARKLGLLQRTYSDWKAVKELTQTLQKLDRYDPVKYDYALFGMGILPHEIPETFFLNVNA